MWLSNFELIITNVVIIYLAFTQNWSTQEILLLFWIQSVIIGIFQFAKILDLKQFSTEGFKSNGQDVVPTKETKYSIAIFFAFHYGFFHLGYLVFILSSNLYPEPNNNQSYVISNLAFPAVIFLVNHLVSFFSNRQQDRQSNKNIGVIMLAPYARIIPMHLTIIFGFAFGAPKLFFLVIRGFIDFISHFMEHHSPKPLTTENI